MRIFALVSVFLVPLCLVAQESTDTVRIGFVTVRSLPSGAHVFIDSVHAGITPLERYELPAGDHELRVFYPTPLDWNAFVQKRTIRVEAGGSIESSFEFGSLLSIHSVPSGASVLFDGSELGQTPLFYRSTAAMRGSVTISKKDYQSVTLPIREMPPLVRLKPDGEVLPQLMVEYSSAAPQRTWITISSGAGMVVFGVAAAYFKDRANKQFDRYSLTNDPSYLSSTHRYDRLSLISLIVTQATFAILVYSLLSDN